MLPRADNRRLGDRRAGLCRLAGRWTRFHRLRISRQLKIVVSEAGEPDFVERPAGFRRLGEQHIERRRRRCGRDFHPLPKCDCVTSSSRRRTVAR